MGSIIKYNNIVRYFLSTNINKLTSTDINFKDSLENKQIVYILLNVLNDTNICDYYNTNQIVILDNIDLFNKLISIDKLNSLDDSLDKNIDIEMIINNIKLLSSKINISNINYNLNIIDNIYYLISHCNRNYYTQLYQIVNNLSIKNIIEIKKRIREIKLILDPIYKIVQDDLIDDQINDSAIDYFSILSMIQVILIIKTKIDNILRSKNIILIVSDNLKIYKQNIENMLQKEPQIIKELLKIFNYSNDQEDDKLINSEIIEHIINILENYYKIYDIIKENFYENEEIDIISYLENLTEELSNLNEMLENYLENSIDIVIDDFIINLKESESINDIIELMIDLIEQIKNNNNVLILDQRLLDLKNENNPINNNEMIKLINNKQNINIICSKILKSLQINTDTNSDEKETEFIDLNLFIINDNINNINNQIEQIIKFYKSDYNIEPSIDTIINILINSNIIYNHNKYNIINIFENKKIFMDFIYELQINDNEIDLKNDILLLMLFKFKSNEKTNEWYERIKIDGLSFYNNNFILDKMDLKIVLNKLEDYFNDIINNIKI